ncbi:MAG: tRNA 2-selenouridine(34) synthase MnmH [Sphingobacteriaceae bacterium]
MIHTIQIEEFLALTAEIPVADVRTPAEFEQGHIPHAHNLPIFTNEERVQVGTTYKQIGREEAILLGFEFTGPKWSSFIKEALAIAPQKKIALHCWRGGMRSGAMAWALNLYGFEVYLLEGGYKSYRRWALEQFNQQFNLLILGGMTGSGKTQILRAIKNSGEQMIDLEELAQHQGSSYGSMGTLIQPSQEQFENNLAYQLSQINKIKPLWLEDESRTIGKRSIPNPLWDQMRKAPVIKLHIALEERIRFLTQEYGKLDSDFLIECTQRIGKRLGPEQTRDAVLAIKENRMSDFIRLVLVYYDKTYTTGQSMREQRSIYDVQGTLAADLNNVTRILEKVKNIHSTQ